MNVAFIIPPPPPQVQSFIGNKSCEEEGLQLQPNKPAWAYS